MNNPNPSGATMIERNETHHEMVLERLRAVPRTRGDDLQLWLAVLRKYYWRYVKVQTRDGSLSIMFSHFSHSFYIPMPESIRRRRQEIQSEEKAKKKMGKEYDEKLLPTERVQRKRERNELAHTHRFGTGNMTLEDFSLPTSDTTITSEIVTRRGK